MVAFATEPEQRNQGFIHVGNGIEVDPATATIRVHVTVVCPAKIQSIPHLMPVVGLDRPAHDPRSDLLVYGRCVHEGDYVFVDTSDTKRMTGEPRRKPIGFGLEDEITAEVAMAMDLLPRK
jgi:hypothetical protein